MFSLFLFYILVLVAGQEEPDNAWCQYKNNGKLCREGCCTNKEGCVFDADTLMCYSPSALLAANSDPPTAAPTETEPPTMAPTGVPTTEPSEVPTMVPTEEPTMVPTEEPTMSPTETPTMDPTRVDYPTEEPTYEPTLEPTVEPETEMPTEQPTDEPTLEPTEGPDYSSTSGFADTHYEWAAICLAVFVVLACWMWCCVRTAYLPDEELLLPKDETDYKMAQAPNELL